VLEADPNEVDRIVRAYRDNPTNCQDIDQKEDGSFKYARSSASCYLS
jgi:hypothetical protein